MDRDILVPPGGRLSAAQVHSAIVPSADPRRALVDLTRAEWVEPVGLVAVAAYAEREARHGRRVVPRAPRRPQLAT